jgi:hypothetical protein
VPRSLLASVAGRQVLLLSARLSLAASPLLLQVL